MLLTIYLTGLIVTFIFNIDELVDFELKQARDEKGEVDKKLINWWNGLSVSIFFSLIWFISIFLLINNTIQTLKNK